MRKILTEEQKTARDNRRAKFRQIAKAVSELTDEQRAAIVNKHGVVTIEGRALSMHNTCLLLAQCPTVSVVGGFRQWIKAGRQVRKGEHGFMIWVPCGKRDGGEQPAASAGAIVLASEAHEGGECIRPGFIVGTVFDVTQTDASEATAPAEMVAELVEA